MRSHIPKMLVALLLTAGFGCGTEEKKVAEVPQAAEEPLSIIFLIGDGMGVPHVSTAYYFGDGTPNFSRFKHIGLQQTSDKTHRITDSAAGATAFSIGEKTFKRAIGVAADSLPRETIMERLQKDGYQSGLISLTTITHATPASFYAHVTDRDLHEDIASQLIGSKVDFIAGGGKRYLNKRSDGQDLFKALEDENYHVDTLELSKPVLDKRNAYILEDEGIPSKIEGRGEFLGDATKLALDYFDQKGEPFFLMVEGSYIDWGGHAENAEMLVTEVLDFDRTLGVVLDYIEKNPNTLLVVTADHETGGVSIGKYYEEDKSGRKREVPDRVAVRFNTDQHSGELIPVFAAGKGAELFQGIYQNSDIYHKMFEALGQKTAAQ